MVITKVTIKRIDQSWNIVSYENCPVGIIVLDSYDQIDGIINLWYLIGEKNLRGKYIRVIVTASVAVKVKIRLPVLSILNKILIF